MQSLDPGINLDDGAGPPSNTRTGPRHVRACRPAFSLTGDQVPARISFDWNFLTSELTTWLGEHGDLPNMDDFFDVTINNTSIFSGSVFDVFQSPHPDRGPYDGQVYLGDDGTMISDGQTGWQTTQWMLTEPGTYHAGLQDCRSGRTA